MSQIASPVLVVPSLIIALDEFGEQVAHRVWERIPEESSLRKRVAFVRYHPQGENGAPAELGLLFPDRLGPSGGQLDKNDRSVSYVVWQAITFLNEVEPLSELLHTQDYYAQLGSLMIYYVGEFLSAADEPLGSDVQPESDTEQGSIATSAISTASEEALQNNVELESETGQGNRQDRAVSANTAQYSFVNFVKEVRDTLSERDLPSIARVGLLYIGLPPQQHARQEAYLRAVRFALTQLLALPMTESFESGLFDDPTPPLTYCYLFSDMDQENRTHNPDDIQSAMALALHLLLASALYTSEEHNQLFSVSTAPDTRADTREELRSRPRLGAMGTSRLFYPRTEIIEYCARRLALERILPRLVLPKLPAEGGSRAQEETQKRLEEAGQQSARQVASEIWERTTPVPTEQRQRRRVWLPSISPLMREMESDPVAQKERATLAMVLGGLEPRSFRLTGDANAWLKRLDDYWPGDPDDPAASINDWLGRWWRACNDRHEDFAKQRLKAIQAGLETAMGVDFASGSVQAFAALDTLSHELDRMREQAEHMDRKALEEWLEYLNRFISATRGERERRQVPEPDYQIAPAAAGAREATISPLPIPSGPPQGSMIEAGPEELPARGPGADFWRIETSGVSFLTEREIHDTYWALKERVRRHYGNRPRLWAVVSLASMVTPIGYFVLRGLLQTVDWPWYVQLLVYAAPLAALALIAAGTRALWLHNLRRRGEQLVWFVRRVVVRKVEEQNLREWIRAIQGLSAEISGLRQRLESTLTYLRETLPSTWEQECREVLARPNVPSRELTVVSGKSFPEKYDRLERMRADQAQAREQDMVARFHEAIRQPDKAILEWDSEEFGKTILNLCTEECRRWMQDESLAQFPPTDPGWVYDQLHDLASPLLVASASFASEKPQQGTLVFAADALSDHPLVQTARERGGVHVVRILSQDEIAVLRYKAGVWPSLLERLPWSLAETVSGEQDWTLAGEGSPLIV